MSNYLLSANTKFKLNSSVKPQLLLLQRKVFFQQKNATEKIGIVAQQLRSIRMWGGEIFYLTDLSKIFMENLICTLRASSNGRIVHYTI